MKSHYRETQPYFCLTCKMRWPGTSLGRERWEVHNATVHLDPKWEDRAACKGMDTNIFFPGHGATTVKQAKAVCAECPVQTECFLKSNHVFSQRYGIWGGMTAKERKAKRVRLGIVPATEVMEEWLFDQRNEPLPFPDQTEGSPDGA
jgi:hypothetical protein